MNLKKILLSSLAVVASVVSLAPAHAALNDAEFTSALSWAYENGLTKYNTEAGFNPYANLTREQFAKFISSFAVTNLCLDVDADASCDFSDIPADASLEDYVVLSCQLGLVKGSAGKYMPTNNVTKAEVLAVIVRGMAAAAGEDAPSEDVNPRWANYFTEAKDAGLTKETDVNALSKSVTRYEVLLMLYRARMEDAECSDESIDDLLADLFGDDTDTNTGDDTTDEVTESDGTAKGMLSPSTPNGATIPGLVSVKVASFDFSATDEDVVLSEITLSRKGLGSDDTVDELTLFHGSEVLTKSKSFNSDDEAVFALNPSVTIKAGQKVTIDVVAKVGDSATVSNEEFSIALIGFDTNGSENTTNLPVMGNTFRIGGVDGVEVIVDDDGNISDVNLGDKGVEVAKFTMENNGDNDVEITQITLEDNEKNADEDLSNFVLKHNGTTIGTVASTNGKYLTFVLTTPIKIAENETEDFRVYADVVAGAGDDISFTIDEEIYVLGKDTKYGYGIAVDVAAYVAQTFAIKAGELTLVEKALPNDLARADRDEFVLAKFQLIPNAGKDLTLEDIFFTLNGTANLNGGADTWDEVFENVELQVVVNSGSVKRFDLDEDNGDANSVEFSDTDLGIVLPAEGTIMVSLVADSVSTFPAGWTNDDSFSVTMLTSLAGGFQIIENEDDENVDDIVPSSLTFDTIDLVSSAVELTRLSLGPVNVVRGSTNIDAIKFQVSADDAGNVFVQSFDFNVDVNVGACTPDSSMLAAVKLWRATGASGGYELLEQQGGFDLSPAGVITFDDFTEVEVMSSKDQVFLLTVDITDDNNLAGCVFDVEVSGADVEDDDNKDLTESGIPTSVGRQITITSAGSLSVNLDETDTLANRNKHVLAGTTSDYIAAFELIGDNEPIEIEDLILNVAGAGAGDFADSISEVILYKQDGTEIGREAVSTTPVMFDNINLVIPDGSMNIYVKVVADMIGSSQNGVPMDDVTIALEVDNAKGDNSGADVTPTYDGVGETDASFLFDVLSVHLSNIAINDAGTVGNTQLSDGNNIIGTIEITANTWGNTDISTNADIEAVLNVLGFTIDDTAGIVTSVSVERMDITTADKVCDANFVGPNYEVDFGSCDPVVAQIDEGVTARYRVEVSIAGAASNNSVQLRFNALNAGDIEYTSTDGAGFGTDEDALRLSIGSSLLGVKKSVSN